MQIRVNGDIVHISGYVNAVERASKTLQDRSGPFVEAIASGAFNKAINRNDDIHVLLNHNWERDLGSTKKGNLKLCENNIGLYAEAEIVDREVAQEAKDGKLVGWSFGFEDREVERSVNNDGMIFRYVKDLDLYEVSILDNKKIPAYDGTLIMAREEGDKRLYKGENMYDDIIYQGDKEKPAESEIRASESEETNIEPKQQEVVEKIIDYSEYENLIKEMKEGTYE